MERWLLIVCRHKTIRATTENKVEGKSIVTAPMTGGGLERGLCVGRLGQVLLCSASLRGAVTRGLRGLTPTSLERRSAI